jgi:hypothetical protein
LNGRSLQIDHVTVAGPDLAVLGQAFAGVGLAAEYGGPHSNGVTHMALLGFNDGSYLELISTLEPGPKDTVFWGKHIAGNAGPCAWAVRVDDITGEAARIAGLGIAVTGPDYYQRRRPDGRLVEWDLAFLGDKGAGATLPFLIQDITPRDRRVRPSASVADGLVAGVDTVVLGVADLEAATALFQRVYSWPATQVTDDAAFGTRLARFAGSPVTLAAPLAGDAWLPERLASFGDSPCAYLLRTGDLRAARQRYPLAQPGGWFGRPLAWFDPAQLHGFRIGLIE